MLRREQPYIACVDEPVAVDVRVECFREELAVNRHASPYAQHRVAIYALDLLEAAGAATGTVRIVVDQQRTTVESLADHEEVVLNHGEVADVLHPIARGVGTLGRIGRNRLIPAARENREVHDVDEIILRN